MKLLVSAIEPSSNVHLKELLKHMEGVELLGVYDASLSESKPLYDISQMAIMGVVDAIKKIRWFYKVANELVEVAKDADKILLMDGSGFNLPLARKLKKHTQIKRLSTIYCLKFGLQEHIESKSLRSIVISC